AEASGRLRSALQHTYSAGVRTNERWLARILAHPGFLESSHSISFLETHGQELRNRPAHESVDERHALALAALALRNRWDLRSPAPLAPAPPAAPDTASPWVARDGFTPNLPAIVQFTLQLRGQQHSIEIETGSHGSTAPGVDALSVRVGAASLTVSQVVLSDGSISASMDGLHRKARALVYHEHVHLWLGAEHYDLLHEDPRSEQFSASHSSGDLTTPLPGVVAAVAVTAGQEVAAGEVLMVIEAMKMEHSISAPYAGTVQAVHFARGDRVPEGSTLLELAPQE